MGLTFRLKLALTEIILTVAECAKASLLFKFACGSVLIL